MRVWSCSQFAIGIETIRDGNAVRVQSVLTWQQDVDPARGQGEEKEKKPPAKYSEKRLTSADEFIAQLRNQSETDFERRAGRDEIVFLVKSEWLSEEGELVKPVGSQ